MIEIDLKKYRPLLEVESTNLYLQRKGLKQKNLPEDPGLYAFWWIGAKQDLLKANREIVLAGPGGINVPVSLKDWWPKELDYPCLYVGKTTNIKKRFGQHLLKGTPHRTTSIPPNNKKQKPKTTSCQLRHGIEHIFKNEANPLDLIYKNVGFSYMTSFKGNPTVERFYGEDLLVGILRPWINIDSER